ncbi:hypothetical protein Tco_0873989 [Tanacetum coccineum]|uniref:Uncharacterized protein n=1 Tax=Tanacetum coccineum TaxID=301880 RepID=A0ABQ5BN98_9ASTR
MGWLTRELCWGEKGAGKTVLSITGKRFRVLPLLVPHGYKEVCNFRPCGVKAETPKPEIKVYSRRPKQVKSVGSSKKAKIVQSKIANNSKPTHLWGSNATDVPSSSSLVNDRLSRFSSGTVRFGNDQVAKIIKYGDYQLGNNLEGVDLLLGFRDTNLYTISLDDMLKTSPICLLSKASKTKSWTHASSIDSCNIQLRTRSKPYSSQPCNPPNRDDWDHLFQPMFDEYFNPPTIVVSPVSVVAAPRAVDIADSHVSTSIDQDAPSTSITSTQEQEHSPIISQGVEESPKTLLFHDDPLHEDSTSQGSSFNIRPSHTPFELIGRWTKDHRIANVIGDPSRSFSTRKQLKTDAM